MIRLLLLLGLLLAGPLHAAIPEVALQARLRPAAVTAPGEVVLQVTVAVPPGAHINAAQPTFDFHVPTELVVQVPRGMRAAIPRLPAPHFFTSAAFDSPVAVYDGTFAVPVAVRIDDAAAGTHELAVTLRYQACDAAMCYAPATARATARLQVAGKAAPAAASGETDTPAPPGGEAPAGMEAAGGETAAAAPAAPAMLLSLPVALLFAFVGGIILNLMPCVFPVLGLKVFSLVQQAQATRKQALLLGLAYTLGVLVLFWLLAGAIIGLRAAGSEVGWGFQFQNPYFIAAVSAVVLVFTLALFGVFEIGLSGGATDKLAQASSGEGLRGAFLSGMFATLLATPCTAPFLGAAMGFAFSQGTLVLFAAFTAAGLGLACPFLLLAVIPGARRLLPKPGVWMLKLKQGFGFLLLATLLWLLSVLLHQVSPAAAVRVAAWHLVAAFAVWLVADRLSPVATLPRRLAGWSVVLLVLAGGYALLVHPVLGTPAAAIAVTDGWEPYSEARLAELQARGRIIFVDATASWCLTCAANHVAVLDTERARELFRAHEVVLLRADWTNSDPQVTALLQRLGRAGVPAYAVWHGTRGPQVLPEVLTFAELEAALQPVP